MPEFDKRPAKQTAGVSEDSKNHGAQKVARRKENLAVGIFRGLIPWKGDDGGDIVRKLVFLLSLTLIVYASIKILDFYVFNDIRTDRERDSLMESLQEYEGPDSLSINIQPEEGSHYIEPKQVEVIGEYYETFFLKNEDFIGYLEIYPIIQYPVYQADDNEFYLNHNHDKTPTANGTVFADYRGTFSATERPHNSVIYGHNLLTKNLFQPLTYYRPNSASGVDSFEFLKQHPIITFDTLYERGKYKIFAVFQSNVKAVQGEVFDYWRSPYFEDKEHFDNFVADCLDRSFYFTNVDLEYGDEILLLSTCDFSMFANGADSSVRLVVAARRVREGEDPMFTQDELDAFIDNRGNNEYGQLNRRMFEAYYNLRSVEWGGRNWDLNYIKDFEG
ncbi:MAG: class B sortase [Oscillospiraceae bacterium]|nr:class B sortase [Oscillospiraceae bacterium]